MSMLRNGFTDGRLPLIPALSDGIHRAKTQRITQNKLKLEVKGDENDSTNSSNHER